MGLAVRLAVRLAVGLAVRLAPLAMTTTAAPLAGLSSFARLRLRLTQGTSSCHILLQEIEVMSKFAIMHIIHNGDIFVLPVRENDIIRCSVRLSVVRRARSCYTHLRGLLTCRIDGTCAFTCIKPLLEGAGYIIQKGRYKILFAHLAHRLYYRWRF